MILFLLLSTIPVTAFADDKFCWQSCYLLSDGSLAACGTNNCGNEADMLDAEKAARKNNIVFNREYSNTGKFAIKWDNGNGLIEKDATKGEK